MYKYDFYDVKLQNLVIKSNKFNKTGQVRCNVQLVFNGSLHIFVPLIY